MRIESTLATIATPSGALSRTSVPGQGRRGFTLIELLVVISIISVMIAILLPSLGAARDQANKVLCSNRTRQMFLVQSTYSNEYKGFYPRAGGPKSAKSTPSGFPWAVPGTSPTIWTVGLTWAGNRSPMESYFPDQTDALRCPDYDTGIHSFTGYQEAGGWGTTYWVVAGIGYDIGDYEKHGSIQQDRIFYGRNLRNGSTKSDPSLRSWIPNIDFAGRTIANYSVVDDDYGPIYVAEPAEQPVIVEPMTENAYGRKWLLWGVGAGTYLAQDSHEDGGNVLFADGHGAWRLSENVTSAIYTYNIFVNIEW